MADNYPEEPVTWLSVGVYYLTIGKIAESRRFFSKASMMDPHFGPAWIGFAHTFAAEGEHDQAISAYSTAARLFQGTHLPQLFLGMQHLQLNNITLADEYLNNAFTLCKSDPLLLNELGVVFYHKDHLKESVQLFTKALDIAEEIESDPKAWIATRANLAHAYRRLEFFDKALEQFFIVKRTGEGKDANVYSAIGLCQMQLGRPWEAVVSLHEVFLHLLYTLPHHTNIETLGPGYITSGSYSNRTSREGPPRELILKPPFPIISHERRRRNHHPRRRRSRSHHQPAAKRKIEITATTRKRW